MRVQDFTKIVEVIDANQLGSVLMERYENDCNCFWLSHESQGYPVLVIIVKGELASLHFLRSSAHEGNGSSSETDSAIA